MARSLAVSRGVEAERQTLPIEAAGIASPAVLTRDFPVEAKRRPVVDTGRVLIEMLRQKLATRVRTTLRSQVEIGHIA